ncbi:hypothetical protein EON79_21975 [bacterium]|nr:MAG: hypothetical protein EON79_21975 [bacterium]
MNSIVTAGGDVRLTLIVNGTDVPMKKTAAERLGPWVEENWSVPAWEALAYVERLEAALGREIDEEEADRLIEPVLNVLKMADELRRVLAGNAVAIPYNARGGTTYVEVHELDEDLPTWADVYEQDLAQSRQGAA